MNSGDHGSRLDPSSIRLFAERVFGDLFPEGYDGEVLLCGGAFKPLLQPGLTIADLDLWVRNAVAREQLWSALATLGAVLVQDFRPYCIKFILQAWVIEVTYSNVENGRLCDVIDHFDLALCAVGARYVRGSVTEVFVSAGCCDAVRHRMVTMQESHLDLLRSKKDPRLLSSLHRMKRQAAQFGYEVDTNHEWLLWHLYWKEFTKKERDAALEFYFDTICRYKGQYDESLVRRASSRPSWFRSKALEGFSRTSGWLTDVKDTVLTQKRV